MHSLYISPIIFEEVKDVFKEKQININEFFLRLIDEIQIKGKFSFISISSINNIISQFHDIGKLNNEGMHKLIDRIWEKNEFGENEEKENIKFIFSKCKRQIYKRHLKIKDMFFNESVKIPSHKREDKAIKRQIEEENLKELFGDGDKEILFDLNEYAKDHPELELCLVTWDDNFIEAVRILLDKLSFKRYIGKKYQSI